MLTLRLVIVNMKTWTSMLGEHLILLIIVDSNFFNLKIETLHHKFNIFQLNNGNYAKKIQS
jgi:hypothetical protein